ncbi:NAD(P)-dependent oxidoreductase [Sinomonas soli]
MSTVVVTEDVTGPAYDRLAAARGLRRDAEAWRSPDRLRELLAHAEAVIVRNRTQVDRAFLEAAPSLKVVARAGVGMDNIDLEAADRAGVVVVAPLGANAASVAEHALSMALALSKSLIPSSTSTKAGGWDRTPTQELRGRTWGLLSAGATARATARLARSLGMDIVAYDPYIGPDHPEVLEIGLELAPLDEVLSRAQVLSVHLPHSPATERLLDAHRLALLPRGALLISVGRGEVVDESALLEALTTGRLGGAGLDVRAQEPPTAGALETLPNVILTPHVAGITVQAQHRIGEILCDQITTVLDGGRATCAVGSHAAPARETVA